MRMPAYHHSIKLDDKKHPINLTNHILKRVKTPESKSLFGKPVHAVISMSPMDENMLKANEGLKKLEKLSDKYAKSVGMHGYTSIYHHIRLEKEIKEKPEISTDDTKIDLRGFGLTSCFLVSKPPRVDL